MAPKQGEADVTARRPAVFLAATLAFALGIWGWHASEWSSAAQSTKSGEKNAPSAAPKGHQGIVVVVNGEAITAYDIEQRARLLSLGDKEMNQKLELIVKSPSTEAQVRALEREVVTSNPGKSKEELVAIFQERQKQLGADLRRQAFSAVFSRLHNEAKEHLIEERLKLQAAKKAGVEISDDDVARLLKLVAEGNKATPEQFAQSLKGMGVDIATMGERFRAREAWAQLIQRRYSALVSVSQRDIDHLLSKAAVEAGEDTVELQVQRIALAGTSDQTALTKQYTEGAALHRKFAGCNGMGELAKTVPEAKFEDMKYVKPSRFAEPIRSMLLIAKDGEMLPPFTVGTSVELYAICGRRSLAGNEEQRTKAMQALQSKELNIWAQRHMRDLRQDAVIETR
jgi:peptidyl-prolyl cis-trans isomerase SurA